MQEDNRGRSRAHGFSEAVGEPDDRLVDAALVQEAGADHVVLRVEQHYADLFLGEIGELRAEVRRQIGWALDLPAVAGRVGMSDLVRRRELGEQPKVLAHQVED